MMTKLLLVTLIGLGAAGHASVVKADVLITSGSLYFEAEAAASDGETSSNEDIPSSAALTGSGSASASGTAQLGNNAYVIVSGSGQTTGPNIYSFSGTSTAIVNGPYYAQGFGLAQQMIAFTITTTEYLNLNTNYFSTDYPQAQTYGLNFSLQSVGGSAPAGGILPVNSHDIIYLTAGAYQLTVGLDYLINDGGDANADYTFSDTVSFTDPNVLPTPLPSSVYLFGSALLCLAGLGVHRNNRSVSSPKIGKRFMQAKAWTATIFSVVLLLAMSSVRPAFADVSAEAYGSSTLAGSETLECPGSGTTSTYCSFSITDGSGNFAGGSSKSSVTYSGSLFGSGTAVADGVSGIYSMSSAGANFSDTIYIPTNFSTAVITANYGGDGTGYLDVDVLQGFVQGNSRIECTNSQATCSITLTSNNGGGAGQFTLYASAGGGGSVITQGMGTVESFSSESMTLGLSVYGTNGQLISFTQDAGESLPSTAPIATTPLPSSVYLFGSALLCLAALGVHGNKRLVSTPQIGKRV